MSETDPDQQTLPPFPLEDILSRESPAGAGESGSRQNGSRPFVFCFYANSRPWGQLPIHAPGPDEVATTAGHLAALFQMWLRSRGFAGYVVTAHAGACPV